MSLILGNKLISEQRVLAAVTFHYVEARLGFLSNVIAALAALPVAKCHIHILTNNTPTSSIEDLVDNVGRGVCQIDVVDNLDHPYDLAWAHKDLIANKFFDKIYDFSHFIYLEDDERISSSNLLYAVNTYDELMEYGFFPSFVRTEWNKSKLMLTSTDSLRANDLSKRPFISAGGYNFVSLDHPYCGCYILNQKLAKLHAASRSFKKDSSLEIIPMDTRERAAMGLLFEGQPKGFTSRGVVPVDVGSRRIAAEAMIDHLPNNYADNEKTPFGKVPMHSIFVGDFVEERRVKKEVVF